MDKYLIGVSTTNSLTRADSWWWLAVPTGTPIPKYVLVPHDITGELVRGVVTMALPDDPSRIVRDGSWVLFTDTEGRDQVVAVRGVARPVPTAAGAHPRRTGVVDELRRLRQEDNLLRWARGRAGRDPRVAQLLMEYEHA